MGTSKPDRGDLAPRASTTSIADATAGTSGAPVGPPVVEGRVSDFKPAALPPNPGPKAPPTEAEQREMAKTALGLDEQQMQVIEAPVVTAECVVRLTEVGTYIAARFRTVAKRRPWDAEKAEAARFTPGAREDIKAFAPFALPYLQQSAAANPWLGLAMFAMVAYSATGDSFARIAEIEKRRGEDIKPKDKPATGREVIVQAQPVSPPAPPAPGPPIVS